ncbi:MAG: hypothetical protein C4339_04430 [Nitrososphaerota archaeon]
MEERARLLRALLRLVGQPVSRRLLVELFGEEAVEGLLGTYLREVQPGLVAAPGSSMPLGARERARYLRAVSARLAHLIASRGIVMAGLSGSVTYGVLGPKGDLDLFLVTRPGRLVRELLRAFVQLRALNRTLPIRVEVSLAMDAPSFVRHTFLEGDPLVRMDASRALLLKGAAEYARLEAGHRSRTALSLNGPGPLGWFIEGLLFTPLRAYVGLRGLLLNLSLRRRRSYLHMFQLRFTPRSYVAESARYALLRRLYWRLLAGPRARAAASYLSEHRPP